MRPLKAFWRFLAEIIVVAGALSCILYWLGVKPGDLRMTPTWLHWVWLAVGLLLFAIGIGLSSFSFFVYRRRAEGLATETKSTIASVRRECEDEIRRSELLHKDQEYKWNEFYTAYHKRRAELEADVSALQDKLAARDTADAEKVSFTLSALQQDAFRCAQKLREWIAAVGPLATPPAIAGESDEERERRTTSALAAYRARLRFQYESEYKATVQVIYSKFAIENNRDLWIEQFLERVECNQQVLNIADGLEALAIRQFAPTASSLIERKLFPVKEVSEP